MTRKPSAAAIYCRISADPDGTRLGVERQEKDCRELAARKGWPVASLYIDDEDRQDDAVQRSFEFS